MFKMEIETLKDIIVDQEKSFQIRLRSQEIIPRDLHIDVDKVFKVPNLLLIRGPRRAGKSFFAHLLLKDKPYRFFNFDDERLVIDLVDANQIIEAFHALGDFEYIIFDEIHYLKGWEKFIARLRERYKIIVTGSNSELLSKDFGTHLTGRFISKAMLPFSFKEYISWKRFKSIGTEEKAKVKKAFMEYLTLGGYPEALLFGDSYLADLYNSIIIRDIAKAKLRSSLEFRKFAKFSMNNFASKLSMKKAADTLKVTSPTAEKYYSLLADNFLLFSFNKYSTKLLEQEQSQKKVYCIDTGIANAVNLRFSENKGRLLENIVAIRLYHDVLNLQADVFYYDDYQRECDFLVKHGNKIDTAIQVTWQLGNDRETDGLLAAMKAFGLKEGFILTLDEERTIQKDGFIIRVKPVWKWLLE